MAVAWPGRLVRRFRERTPPSVDTPDTIQQADSGRTSRRGILAALGLGGAATALVTSARPAQAQTTETTTAPTEPAPYGTPSTEPMLVTAAPTDTRPYDTTTYDTSPEPRVLAAGGESTPPPKKIQPEDLPLLGAAKVLELTAAQASETVIARLDSLGVDEATAALLRAIAAHHRAYAEAISAAFGPGSPATPNPALLTLLGGPVFAEGTGAEVLKAMQEVEHHCSDTHQTLLGLLISTDAAALVASIVVIEARHAVVLGMLLGQPYGADELAIEDSADALLLEQIVGGK